MSMIDDEFAAAERRVKTLTKRPSNEVLLKLYSLYKQSTQGDVQGERPGMMEFVERAKFDAWDDLQGVARDEAKRRYIDLVDSLFDD
ncbi:MAG: acyl-CoA-binding protein [Holophagales bacterium]|nr:MAG: acyl-CoA-binding protein [Holophagales bacterium]